MKMKNEELDKAFDNFEKSINTARNAIKDFIQMDINKTSEPTLETQRDEEAEARWRSLYERPHAIGWERQTDMNGDVYIRDDEDYLDRD